MGSPLVAQLLQVMGQRREIERAEEIAQQRREALLRQSEEDARRRQQEDVAARSAEFGQDVTIANLLRQQAANTPLEAAPRQTPEEVTAETGIKPLPEGVPGPVPQPDVKRGLTLKLPGGRVIPLAPLKYKEEAEADELRLTKAKHDANADVMDIPDDKDLYGALAGQKGVRTSHANVHLTAEAKRDASAAYAAARQAETDRKAEEGKTKQKTAENSARIDAENMREGIAYPSSQDSTTAAYAYMDAHPEEYPRKPRKLSAPQQQEVIHHTTTVQKIKGIREAYEKVKDKVGPLKYTFNELMQKVPGTAARPEFVRFNTMLRGMNNLEIKHVTGAAMQASEADRLLKAMATGELKPSEFEAAIQVMEEMANLNKEILMYGNVQEPTPTGAPAPAGTTAPAGSKYDSLYKKWFGK